MSVTETVPETDAVVLSPPVNQRDLGGVTVAGGAVRSGFAIRADDLSTITEEVAASLVEGGLRAVIDLRSSDEVAVTGRGPLGRQSPVTYHHVPFIADIGAVTGDADGAPADAAKSAALHQPAFGQLYLHLYETAAAQIVTALAIIAHTPGAVAFHCAAGQDRTGVLAASLLLALGADHDTIVTDYGRTGANSAAIRQRITPVIAPLLRRRGIDLDRLDRAAGSTEFSDAPMRVLLETLTERHSDPLGPLRTAGLTDGLITRLRQRGLTPDAT